MKKRMLSVFMALCVMLTVLPMTALAADGTEPTADSHSESVSYTHLDVYKRQALKQVTHDLHRDGPVGIMTGYEEKFYALGTPICRLEAVSYTHLK